MPNVGSYLAVTHNRFQHRTRVKYYYGTSNQHCFSVESIMVVRTAGKREREIERGRERGVRSLRPVSDCNVFYWTNCSKDGYIDVDGTLPLRGR